MRALLPAFALVALAACGPTREWVPVEVDWTFGGKSCADAGVANIRIDVDNEVLYPSQGSGRRVGNGVEYSCQEADIGAELGDWLTGPYTMTVTGYDDAGNLVYQTTRVVQIVRGGKNIIPFDTDPTTGTASLRWTFAGKSCHAAGVTTVRVSLDGQVITDAQNNPDLPCKATGFEGTIIGPLTPGSHTFAVAANGTSDDYAIDNVNISVAVGQDTPVPVDLQVVAPTTASADVRWTFPPGTRTCADVGADHISVVFDPQADGSGGTVVTNPAVACIGVDGKPVTQIQIVDVPDGYHSFAIRATRQNQLIAYTHHPVTTLFTAPFTTAVDVTAEPLP